MPEYMDTVAGLKSTYYLWFKYYFYAHNGQQKMLHFLMYEVLNSFQMEQIL